MNKLYVVVRGDLPPGAQIAQSCHAVSAYAVASPIEHRTWHEGGQNLVVLAVPNEAALDALLERLWEVDEIRTAEFYEPDLGDSLTAIAVPDTARRLLSQLPLAGRYVCSACPARAA